MVQFDQLYWVCIVEYFLNFRKNIVWLSSDSDDKNKTKTKPRHSVSLEFWCDRKILVFLAYGEFWNTAL